MSQPVEQLEPLEIHSEDDVWNALYTYGIKDSLTEILKFYGHKHEEEIKDEEVKSVENSPKPAYKRINKNKLKELFNSFTDDQLDEALVYFIEKSDNKGLVLFFQSLDKTRQRKILEKILFEAFENHSDKEITEEIRKLRRKLSGTRLPENLDEAINAAFQDNLNATVLFLKENKFQIPKFINIAPEDVANKTLAEMLKYIPDHS
jgi:hypothetical protein